MIHDVTDDIRWKRPAPEAPEEPKPMRIEVTEEMRAELRIISDMRQRLPKMRALGMAAPSMKSMGVHGVNLAILVAEAVEREEGK